MAIGYRIYDGHQRPDPDVVSALGQHYSCDLADSMQKAGAMSRSIAPVFHPMPKFYGAAVTASLPTGSFSMAKMAMLRCQPGEVLVLNAYEDVSHAMVGGHIGHALKQRGMAGMIVDGAVRDAAELQAEELPVCARGTAVVVGGHDGPGEINVPIACGGVVVNPGDIVISDDGGIVVIPRDEAQAVLESVEDLHQRHEKSGPVFDRGEIPGMEAVEERMRQAGCEFVETRK